MHCGCCEVLSASGGIHLSVVTPSLIEGNPQDVCRWGNVYACYGSVKTSEKLSKMQAVLLQLLT